MDATIEDTVSAAGRRALVAMPFAVALGAVVLTYWTIDIVSPALPAIKADLGLSAGTTGLIYSLLFLGRLLGNIPAALLLGRIGTAVTGAAGAAILLAGTVWAAAAPSWWLLSPARILQGIGIALLINACLRAIVGARPGRGAAMTYLGLAATVGGVFGLQSGGYLTETHGWRSVFILSAVLAAVVLATTTVARFAGARVGGAVDVVPAAHASAPADTRALLPVLTINFLVFFNYSVFVALPLYAQHAFGASAEANARLLMVITVVHIVAAVPAGRFIRKWGSPRVLVGGMLVAIAGTALILPAPSPVWMALPLLLYGAGQVTATNAGGDHLLHLGQQSTRTIGLLRFSSDAGLVVGPYASGALSDRLGYGAPFVALPVVLALATAYAAREARRAPR